MSLALNYEKGFPLIPGVLQTLSTERICDQNHLHQPSSKWPSDKRENGLISTIPLQDACGNCASTFLGAVWRLGDTGRSRTFVKNENQIKVSNWAARPTCKQNEDMRSSFCHRLERENFLENKKCFFFLKSKSLSQKHYVQLLNFSQENMNQIHLFSEPLRSVSGSFLCF